MGFVKKRPSEFLFLFELDERKHSFRIISEGILLILQSVMVWKNFPIKSVDFLRFLRVIRSVVTHPFGTTSTTNRSIKTRAGLFCFFFFSWTTARWT